MIKEKLNELKDAVREWISIISVDELMTNRDLTTIFESIETTISKIESDYV